MGPTKICQHISQRVKIKHDITGTLHEQLRNIYGSLVTVFVSEEQPALCEFCSEANKTVTPNLKYPGNIQRVNLPHKNIRRSRWTPRTFTMHIL